MAKRIRIGSLDFQTKKSAETFIQSIVASYQDGETITGNHHTILCDLILMHPEAEQKIGCGIDGFTIATEPLFRKNRHFVLVRSDGSRTDFSWPSCLKGKRDIGSEVMTALRRAIADQIIAFKDDSLKGEEKHCPFRNAVLTADNSHVDYEMPATFEDLAKRWMTGLGITKTDVKITEPADNQRVTEMTEPSQIASWQEFHQTHGILRLISKLANLSEARKS